jgi:hypothetical protein
MLTGLNWVGIGSNGEHGDEPFGSIKMEFSEKQSNCQLLMKGPVPCNYFIRESTIGCCNTRLDVSPDDLLHLK